MGSPARRLLRISEREIGFQRRGFRCGTPQARQCIEEIGASFLHGYHLALDADDLPSLLEGLEPMSSRMRGFGYEGAAMALYLLDRLPFMGGGRFDAFLENRGGDHIYMAYVGAGWAHARLPFGLRAGLDRLDPLLRWLAIDGYGFHQGFFHWPTSVEGRRTIPSRIQGYGRRAFDQGLGRSLWFVDGQNVEAVAASISRFPVHRHADLWAGAGLAITYAGGAETEALSWLRQRAGKHAGWLAQGSAFAVKARARAGNQEAHAEDACRALCDMSAQAASALVDAAQRDLPPGEHDRPAYETWRVRIHEGLAASMTDHMERMSV